MAHRHLALLAATAMVGLICGTSTPACARRAPPPPDFAQGAPVTVLHVIDGDTAWFQLADGRRLKGRFAGINAPECHKRQVRKRGFRSAGCDRDKELFGLQSARIMKRLMASGPVRLHCDRKRNGKCKTGGHGRALVRVTVDGKDVAAGMVRAGAAWPFTKYPDKNRRKLCQIEAKARRAGAGMWRFGFDRVRAAMLPKTRRWYAKHTAACAK